MVVTVVVTVVAARTNRASARSASYCIRWFKRLFAKRRCAQHTLPLGFVGGCVTGSASISVAIDLTPYGPQSFRKCHSRKAPLKSDP